MTAFAPIVRPIIKAALPGLKGAMQNKIAEAITAKLAAQDRAVELSLQKLARENAALRKVIEDRDAFTRKQIKATVLRFAQMMEQDHG